MKFAFICHKLFDERASLSLARALDDLGHPCIVAGFGRKEPDVLSYADVVIEVGHARDDRIPKHCVHIPWVQEYYAGGSDPDYDGAALPHDMIYTFGEPEIIGAPRFKHWRGSLCMGVDPNLLNYPQKEGQLSKLDFSIAGFIAAPGWFLKPSELPPVPEPGHGYNIMAELMALIVRENRLKPLSGSFNQVAAFTNFKEVLHTYIKHYWYVKPDLWTSLYGVAAQNVHETARACNRYTVAKLILSVSDNVEFWGLHWDLWPELAPWSKPFTNDRETLLNLYQRSRINVHDNVFGFAMHSRVLEAMAVGGFIMAHESPHVGKPGQITETFIPGVHYGEYNADNFMEQARYWLDRSAARQTAAMQARGVIKAKHLWHHRAQQILGDLSH